MRDVKKPESEIRPIFATVWPPYGRHPHNIITLSVIVQFVQNLLLQNHMPMTIESSKSKPGVDFPYDVRLFFF